MHADERAAFEHARHVLNGHAPPELSIPPEEAISLDRILLRKQRGNEIALKILSDEDLVIMA
jgi:hypothetical protein